MNPEAGGLQALEVPLQPGTALAGQAYHSLREAILTGQLVPMTPLSVPEVARRLGISRSPAREAIARLAAEGLARVEPRRGAFVALITVEDLKEIYEVREVLEGLACRIAAQRINEEQLAELQAVITRHSAAIEGGDVDAHMAIDQEFHRIVRAVAENGRLTESLGRLQGEIRVAMNTTHRLHGGMRQALAEHEEIFDALQRRDPDAAEEVARRHIRRLIQGLVESQS